MKEIANSIMEVTKNRLTNSLYGTFFVSWLFFHWNFVYAVFVVDDSMILQIAGLLKNDYLLQKYFDIHDVYFWISWIAPFILTYLIIWKLPGWILLDAYGKTEEYEEKKKIIKISQQRRIEQEEARLQEQTAKKVTAVAKQAVEERKMKEADPTIEWEKEFQDFKNSGLYYSFSSIVKAIYENNGNVDNLNNFGERLSRLVPEKILSYAHSSDLVDFADQANEKIKLTPKGKYFTKRFQEMSNFLK